MTLEQMKNVDIRTVDPGTLVDIRGVKVKENQSGEEKLRDYVRQVGNPYCFRVGGVAVKLSFGDSAASLEDRLESLLVRI
jgi:hypothetical protein